MSIDMYSTVDNSSIDRTQHGEEEKMSTCIAPNIRATASQQYCFPTVARSQLPCTVLWYTTVQWFTITRTERAKTVPARGEVFAEPWLRKKGTRNTK